MPRILIRRTASVLLFLLLPLGANSCAARSGGRAANPPPVRVMVYNIHAGKDATGVDNLERVAALIRETSADVVLLQEVDRGTRRSAGVDQPAVLAHHTGLNAAFGKSLDYQGGEYGIAVLSRWPIVSRQTIPLPIDPPQPRSGGTYEPRVALRVKIASPVGELEIINTHLDASGNDRWRRQEIVTLLAIADSSRMSLRFQSLAPGPTFLLVGGDMNSTPESDVQRTVRSRGLRDAWLTCSAGPEGGLTYPADSSVKRIDYLYFAGATTCEEARVPLTRASDHRPLLVDVLFRPPT